MHRWHIAVSLTSFGPCFSPLSNPLEALFCGKAAALGSIRDGDVTTVGAAIGLRVERWRIKQAIGRRRAMRRVGHGPVARCWGFGGGS